MSRLSLIHCARSATMRAAQWPVEGSGTNRERWVPDLAAGMPESLQKRGKGFTVASTEVEHFTGVDTVEVPSAAWGWSRINHRTWHITGLVIFVFLLAMLRGNHVGHIENWFLIGFAAVVLLALVRDLWGRRRGWIR